MAIESDGHSRGNPRIYELLENAPKTGKSPTIWAWPEVMDWLRVAGQPVPGPWPPHQQPRPNPEEESLPVAIVEPKRPAAPPASRRGSVSQDTPAPPQAPVPPQTYESENAPAQKWRYGSDDEPSARHGIGLMDS